MSDTWPPWHPGDRITAERLNYMMKLKHGGFTRVVAAKDSLFPEMADYVCDGQADQDEINQAIKDLPSAGGRVVLMEGTYYLNVPEGYTKEPVVVIDKPNVILQGCGQGTVIYEEGYGAMIGIYASNVALMDMLIKGIFPAAGRQGGIGPQAENVSDVLFHNVHVMNTMARGFRLYNVDRATIANCRVYQVFEEGMEIIGSNRVLVFGNRIQRAYYEGIELEGPCNFCIVAHNWIEDCSRYLPNHSSGIALRHWTEDNVGPCDCMVVGNIVRGTLHDYGVKITGAPCQRNIVAHNDLYQSGSVGAILDNGTDTVYFGGNKT
jgi:hypothetical protein